MSHPSVSMTCARARVLAVAGANLLAFFLLAACVGDLDGSGDGLQAAGADTGWRTVQHLYHRDRINPDQGEWGARVTYPDRANLEWRNCGADCTSHRHSLVTCPGVYYPNVDGIQKDGGFVRRTNGSETGRETGLHIGFFFYTCDDFCGKRGCPGQGPADGRENEYGIKINVATNRFNFYQSYDSNNCGARHRIDGLNGNFKPGQPDDSFRILVMPDGTYRVKQLNSKGELVASQSISNCTMDGDCDVLCGGGQPACDGECPLDCRAKHSDQVNLFQARGKVDVHTMKKQGTPYVYWSDDTADGNPSTNLANLVRIHSSGDARGTCDFPAGSADSEPNWDDGQDSGGSETSTDGDSGTSTCTPATCDSVGQTCGTWPDGCGGTLDCGACSDASCGASCMAGAQDACACDDECCEGQCNTHGRCCIPAAETGCTADADCCNSATYGGPNQCDGGGKCCRPVGSTCTSSNECCANHTCSAGKCK